MAVTVFRRTGSAAASLAPLVERLLGGPPPVPVRFWDGSRLGPDDAHAPAAIVVRRPEALRRLVMSPDELGFGRAYVAGDLDVEGDLYEVLRLRDRVAAARPGAGASLKLGPQGWLAAARAAVSLGAVGRPLPPPPEEVRLAGRVHSKRRDERAIAHHYDVSNDFYRLVLGDSMTYSCAYFPDPAASLEEAQAFKHEAVCTKLGLRPGMRFLDVGCGWGSMVLHAARHHGVEAVGVTLSRAQADLARARVAAAGLGGRVEIRLCDYRDITDGPYDAVSSIGMFEHVGRARMEEYFAGLRRLIRPQGRLLNHAISRPPGPARRDGRSFLQRYVFPDGEVLEVGTVISAMQEQGFEVRDVESLREHYARTLRHWAANLDRHWEAACAAAGPGRARVWRLYMAACALNFEAGRSNVHQVLGVVQEADGRSGMPAVRPPVRRPTAVVGQEIIRSPSGGQRQSQHHSHRR